VEANRRPHLLIPISSVAGAGRLIEIGEALLRRDGGSGHVLGIVEIPIGKPIAHSLTVARRYRGLLQRMTAMEERRQAGLGVQVRVAHNLAQGIREAAYENGSDTVLAEWPGLSARQRRNGSMLDDLIADPPADLLLVRDDPDRRLDELRPSSILAPVRGGPSAALALRTAAALADATEARLTVMHVYDLRHQSPERRRRECERFHDLLQGLHQRNLEVLEVDSRAPSQAILEEAQRHQVTVLGAYAEVARSSLVVGSRLADAVRHLPGTVIMAKSPRAAAHTLPDPEAVHPLGGRPISTLVDKWFAENTFHSREFRDLDRLAELKRRQGLKISLGLPTLNEQTTVGKIIRVLKEELCERHGLLDEIVVIDSGSSDNTVQIARSLGVPVVQHSEILTDFGTFAGKGEALWKSLHYLSGDIVVWCDTDISNIHPQFVYGVVGPLLTDPRISYVKGFYRRPLNFGQELHTAGGGRVTELTARPLINLFYPELSGLLQPLSGEYAGRRELLERLPFFTGYGVEIGHLIDILENFGLNRIAQVDLGVRIHRNQELFDLSKMAFAIMQVAVKRLGDRHRIHLVEELNRSMKLIQYASDRLYLEVKEIADWERPPMTTLAEYLARRHQLASGVPALEREQQESSA
jgi:glucosyl-3-phosphoglycerate synthase